jgi:hypothetical protein
MAEQMVQVSYNAQHKIPWHWPVPAYLVTKGIGAGLFMLLSLGHWAEPLPGGRADERCGRLSGAAVHRYYHGAAGVRSGTARTVSLHSACGRSGKAG